ncbi:MAG: heme ABC transporter permease [Alphaproteobacteria bacterium]|nr:heme ABC transporter permease [Alphaproteobacteria bacterium]
MSTMGFPILLALCLVCFCVGSYYALVTSPADYQHGDYVRLMYVHVPSAWLAIGIYGMMGVSAFLSLWLKIPLFHYFPKAAAPIGLTFTVICLITGALWGKIAWGTYWVWDARLTSMFVLFLIYLSYFLLLKGYKNEETGLKFSHYLLMVGLINLPIIKFSVTWWYTLHQPASIMKFAASSIHSSMLAPLLWMFFGYAFFFLAFVLLNLRSELSEARLRNMNNRISKAESPTYTVIQVRSAG